MKALYSLIGIAAVAALGFFGYRYYSTTYQGVTAYAKVPAQTPAKEPTKDNQGKVQDGLYSYNYKGIDFVKEDGSHQVMDVEISSENPQPMQPNSYVTAKISKKRVLEGPNPVQESDIPAKAKEQLK